MHQLLHQPLLRPAPEAEAEAAPWRPTDLTEEEEAKLKPKGQPPRQRRDKGE